MILLKLNVLSALSPQEPQQSKTQQKHISDVTWGSWPLKRPATQLFVEQLVHQQRKSPSSALLVLCQGNPPADQWIPLTKGQWCGKGFHVMTSSCIFHTYPHPTLRLRWESLTPSFWKKKKSISSSRSIYLLTHCLLEDICGCKFKCLIFKHVFVADILTLNVRGPSYLGLTRSIS